MREPFMLSFPLDEYRARLDKLIAIMQRDGIDAAIFTSDNNTFYFTGFQSIVWGSKVSTPGVVVVTADGGLALCTTRGGVETAKVTSLVEDIRYTGAGGYPTLAECIASVLADRKLLSGRIGLELGYGRAAKIIDRMQEMGFVSPADGNKPRKVLLAPQDLAEIKMNKRK